LLIRSKKTKKDEAIAYASRLLRVRPRSEKELRDRLFQKNFRREAVFETISFLKENRIIDDLRFADLWVESRLAARPEGGVLLRKELREKGVSSAIIDKVMAEKAADEAGLVRELARRKYEGLKTFPRRKARKKVFDFLARRGFGFDIIEDAVRELEG